MCFGFYFRKGISITLRPPPEADRQPWAKVAQSKNSLIQLTNKKF